MSEVKHSPIPFRYEDQVEGDTYVQLTASIAYFVADAMIQARNL